MRLDRWLRGGDPAYRRDDRPGPLGTPREGGVMAGGRSPDLRRLAGRVPVRATVDGDPLILMSDIQKYMRKCRYPYGAMVKILLFEAGIGVPGTVVDLTYGLGKFWSCIRPKTLIAYDIRKLDWVVVPDKFVKMPAWAAVHDLRSGKIPRPDIIAVDPPWQECIKDNGCSGKMRSVGGAWWFRASRAWGTPQTILEASAKLASIAGVPLLVHYEDKWIPDGFKPIVSIYWKPSLPKARKEYKTWWAILIPKTT